MNFLLKPMKGQVYPWEDDRESLLPESVAMEYLGSLHHHEQEYEDIDGRDEKIDVPFPALAANLNPHDDVVDRYQRLPRLNASLFEYEP